MTIRKANKWSVGLALSGVVILLACQLFEEANWVFWLFIGLGIAQVIAAIVISIVYIRCPACGSHFFHHRGVPHFCPDCGEKVDLEKAYKYRGND